MEFNDFRGRVKKLAEKYNVLPDELPTIRELIKIWKFDIDTYPSDIIKSILLNKGLPFYD